MSKRLNVFSLTTLLNYRPSWCDAQCKIKPPDNAATIMHPYSARLIEYAFGERVFEGYPINTGLDTFKEEKTIECGSPLSDSMPIRSL